MSLTQYLFESVEVRIVQDSTEPMFVASDVCRALTLSDVSMAVSTLQDDEKGTSLICTPSGEQNMLCVTEAGLYRLIFRSRKAAAERFRRWIFHEVLPEIRRTGAYRLKNATPVVRQSIISFLIEKYPDHVLSPKLIIHYGQTVRKVAHALGVRGVLLEDEHVGEALAWPLPFLIAIDTALSGPKRLTQGKSK